SQYAYAFDGRGTIHVVSVATGADRSVAVHTPADTAAGIQVEDFDGRYADFGVFSTSGHPHGIWRIDLTGAAVTPLAQVSDVFAVRNGSAWIGYLDPHDPNPPQLPQGGESVLFNSIVQVNLTTGVRTTWFYRPGQSVELLAIDGSGKPVVSARSGPDFVSSAAEIRRLDEPLSGGEDNGELV